MVALKKVEISSTSIAVLYRVLVRQNIRYTVYGVFGQKAPYTVYGRNGGLTTVYFVNIRYGVYFVNIRYGTRNEVTTEHE